MSFQLAVAVLVFASALPRLTAATPSVPTTQDAWSGAVLPPSLLPETSSSLSVGLGGELFGGGLTNDELLALTLQWRVGPMAVEGLLMVRPSLSTAGYENTRYMSGVQLRSYVPFLGSELCYGVGLHVEARLADHFWLAYATPLEVGAVAFRRRGFEVSVFLGVRVPMAGELIDSFLLDPNGFENEQAIADLDRAKHEAQFRGFVRLMFSRRLN